MADIPPPPPGPASFRALNRPTFGRRQRLARLAWRALWLVAARWTPPPLFAWRAAVLRWCGARVAPGARVYPSVSIWWPPNLAMGAHASLGPGVICYDVAPITIEPYAIVSQRAHLCAGGHDIDDPAFPLVARPIVIGRGAWIAAEAFVAPGVVAGEGAVLGARAVATRDLAPWTVYAGNPATARRQRRRDGAVQPGRPSAAAAE
ncbi:putative colanic acid biosynthesis acetyltransferase [Methylopila sp. Yamaguchi]|uniref:putative colanic acid biosynthesis acetyltransferase n=1 Tax=Methylopila sp. Yamaguchi TaxID=1437817 RepID=UPI000CA99AFE|nr:putative colanic acid biosynthesis acetyltransferase [Methylopila sp. Yamaguchi]GBD48052.1 acetyltransferase [Methylopila sp. Yamaguchi]